MQLCDIFLGLGEDTCSQLIRSISLGKLKTYQLFERVKTRLYVHKLNSEALRKCGPRVWERLNQRDDDFANEISQAILISHMDMIKTVLDHLGIPHEEGFFAKDADVKSYLKDGWQGEVWEKYRATYPSPALLFYINHLAFETLKAEEVFAPAV